MIRIEALDGITFENPIVGRLVDDALQVVVTTQSSVTGATGFVVSESATHMALLAVVGGANALIAFGGGVCTRDAPPSSIQAVVDSSGDLILRCGHHPAHEWNYSSGKQR